jgi:hypothetical protein
MQPAVPDPRRAGEIDRARKLRHKRKRLLDGRRRVVSHRDVERLGSDVLLRPVGNAAFDARGDRFDNRWMEQSRFAGAAQRVRERARLFRNDVEPEDLDGDEAVAGWFVCAEDGTKCTDANLMQNPKRAEGRRRNVGVRGVSSQ